VRLKRDEDQLRVALPRPISRAILENPLMTKMHAVEISDGHDGLPGRLEQAF